MSHKQIHKVYKILFESQKKKNDGKLRKDDILHRIMDYDQVNPEALGFVINSHFGKTVSSFCTCQCF